MRYPSVAMAVATLIAALLAPATPAAERGGSEHKSGGAGKSTGLLIDGEARDAGAKAFSASKKDKCDDDDQDKDDDRIAMRAHDRGKHPRPDCDDDDDDDNDCDGSSGHHGGGHKDKDKDRDCHKSPKK